MSSKKKQQQLSHSIDPELYARSQAPSSTIAMGMKPSYASSLCWVKQVDREQALHKRWCLKYDENGKADSAQSAALDRTLERDHARKDYYLNESTNPELHRILYRSADTAGWQATASIADKNSNSNSGKKRATTTTTTTTMMMMQDSLPAIKNDNGSDQAAQEEADALAREMEKRKVKPSVKYLEVRYNNYGVPERFPHGPATANQTIGWAAAVAAVNERHSKHHGGNNNNNNNNNNCLDISQLPSMRSGITTADLYRPTRPRAAVHAYRKPEDDDHAFLFGYDLEPK